MLLQHRFLHFYFYQNLFLPYFYQSIIFIVFAHFFHLPLSVRKKDVPLCDTASFGLDSVEISFEVPRGSFWILASEAIDKIDLVAKIRKDFREIQIFV
jgi:hypothetical protein